jgi:asparagine N-glycosylation enzyme membrane subunit Stt3
VQRRWWLWLGLFLVAWLTRFVGWEGVYSPAGVLLRGTDAWLHLHRVRMLIAEGSVGAETALNTPDGGATWWPTLYDALLAIPLTVVPEGALAWWAALIPPLLGVALAFAVRWMAMQVAAAIDRPPLAVGWWAAFVAAVLPAARSASGVGAIDHHAVEPVILALAVGGVLGAARAQRSAVAVGGLALGLCPALCTVAPVMLAIAGLGGRRRRLHACRRAQPRASGRPGVDPGAHRDGIDDAHRGRALSGVVRRGRHA